MITTAELIDALTGRRGKVAILCGAGISVRSGLPAASPMLEYILVALGIDLGDIESLKSPDGAWRMPFEAFMEAFIEHDQNTTLFDIFLLGQPNQNHFLIKKLALEGCLGEVCTTNFDLLIERAFAAAPSVPLQLVLEGAEAEPRGPTATSLIKLHGTASDKATIRSTILSIASGDPFEARTQLVRRFLHSTSSVLWVWGYSCSDVLDINPAIAGSAATDKTVVLLSHDPTITELTSARVSPLSQLPEDNPFHSYAGYSIAVNSDLFTSALLRESSYPSAEAIERQDWQTVVHTWINSLAYSHVTFSILCHLFYGLAEFDLALKYNTEAIRANAGKDQRGVGAALSNGGMILFRLGKNLEALAVFRDALACFEAIGFRFGVATSHNNIGYVSAQLGNFAEGYGHLELGLQLVAAGGFREARLCEGYLIKSRGELSLLEAKFADAEECYNTALAIFAEGYVAEQAEVMMLKGKLYRRIGKRLDADALLKAAVALASKVGNVDVVREATRLLGDQ